MNSTPDLRISFLAGWRTSDRGAISAPRGPCTDLIAPLREGAAVRSPSSPAARAASADRSLPAWTRRSGARPSQGVDGRRMGKRGYMALLLLFLLPLGLALVLLTTSEPHKHGRHRHTR